MAINLLPWCLVRTILSLFPLFLFLTVAGCGSQPERDLQPKPGTDSEVGYGVGGAGNFANNPAALRFAQTMQQRYGFDAKALMATLSRAKYQSWIVKQMDKPVRKRSGPEVPTGAWNRYRANFVSADNIEKGVAFWQQYRGDLQRASAKYGVPPEIIVGIIGVETRWGRMMGKTRIIDALATLAFAYPRRSEYFTKELEDFFLMTREEGIDPLQPTGSFAGAMGYG